MGMLLSVKHERSCVKCKIKRNGRPLVISIATLYTMGGRVAVRTGDWTCKCKKEVRYDGADSALFAFSSKTVFKRVYLDIVLHIALTSRSNLTATAAAMAFCLHVTSATTLPGKWANATTSQQGYWRVVRDTHHSRFVLCLRALLAGERPPVPNHCGRRAGSRILP